MTGRKRHLLVDTLGLVLVAHVQPASEQDRRGAGPVLAEAGQQTWNAAFGSYRGVRMHAGARGLPSRYYDP